MKSKHIQLTTKNTPIVPIRIPPAVPQVNPRPSAPIRSHPRYDFDGPGGRDIANGYRDWLDVDETGTDLANDDPPGNSTEADNMWYISRRQIGNNSPAGLEKAVPGDIMYYFNGNNYHVTIIQNVEYTLGSRVPTINMVRLIEAVYGADDQSRQFGSVTKSKTIDNYNNRNWRVGRLKTQ